jgi:hypothetical protein
MESTFRSPISIFLAMHAATLMKPLSLCIALLPFSLASVAVLMNGCELNDERLELTAKALRKAADECLLDVRDRRLKYEASPNCNSLRTLSMQHTEAGGFSLSTPPKYALIAAEARATAWAARAVSASGNPGISIW